jgi:hypothetical protein
MYLGLFLRHFFSLFIASFYRAKGEIIIEAILIEGTTLSGQKFQGPGRKSSPIKGQSS